MKLRNKKTGEIVEWDFGNWYQHILNPDNEESYECTLSEFIDRTAKFREEWENYEEQKENMYWCISQWGDIVQRRGLIPIDTNDMEAEHKEIGNYFETKEEAEKAVEKLKAWKRLKDKGFEFAGWGCENQKLYAKIQFNKKAWATETEPDLNLLFGGEE